MKALICVYRFKSLVFGVAESSAESFPYSVRKLQKSMYVDDMVCGAATEDKAYQLYEESKDMLSRGGFNLHKFVTKCKGELY